MGILVLPPLTGWSQGFWSWTGRAEHCLWGPHWPLVCPMYSMFWVILGKILDPTSLMARACPASQVSILESDRPTCSPGGWR